MLLQHMTDRKVVTAAGNRAALFTNEAKTFHFKIKHIIQANGNTVGAALCRKKLIINKKLLGYINKLHHWCVVIQIFIVLFFLFSNFTLLH